MPIKRRAAVPTESMVCMTCTSVPFGSVNLIGILSAILCVMSVLIVLASLIIQTQQFQIQRLAQTTAAAAARP